MRAATTTIIRSVLALAITSTFGLGLGSGCKTVPDNLEQSSSGAVASATVPGEKKLDLLASCRATGTPRGVTWQCPNDVTALDMQSEKHDDAAEIAQNLDRFAEPFVAMGIPRDNTELTTPTAKLRSAKLSGEKPQAGTIVARMAVVDSTPTRYVSCAAKRDACDDVLRALLLRTPGAH